MKVARGEEGGEERGKNRRLIRSVWWVGEVPAVYGTNISLGSLDRLYPVSGWQRWPNRPLCLHGTWHCSCEVAGFCSCCQHLTFPKGFSHTMCMYGAASSVFLERECGSSFIARVHDVRRAGLDVWWSQGPQSCSSEKFLLLWWWGYPGEW